LTITKFAEPAVQRIATAPPRFATTINYLKSPAFAARARLIKRPSTGRLKDGLSIFRRVLRSAAKEDVMLLASSWGQFHPDLLSAAVMGLWPAHKRPTILLLGCMWEPDGGVPGLIERQIVKLADRAIDCYIVQSTEELEIFPRIWGVSPKKVRFCPFFFELNSDELNKSDYAQQQFVFAGGNSHRDYTPLVEAARQLPDLQFVLATHLLDERTDLPPNVRAGTVSHREFMELMCSAAATVVAIRPGLHRAAGQRTYLNAMWLRRPTIVTDTLGVHDHIRHLESGLIVDGSPESYVQALRWVFTPENRPAVTRLCNKAHEVVDTQFSFEKHIARVLSIVDEVYAK
jgi:glycosyltransferase involved in cell wall biosynthesis